MSEIRGVPQARELRGKTYWYDKHAIGQDTKLRYIGPDSDELRARMERHNELKDARAARSDRRTRLIRVLRAEGYFTPPRQIGSLLSAMADAGVFRLGGTLVGTVAFQLYEGELGVQLLRSGYSMTDDIDIASFERLALTLEDTANPDLIGVLRDFRFKAQPGLNRKVWRWEQLKTELLVEFLTPSFGDEQVVSLPTLGVGAQGLHFLNYLIADPIPAAVLYRSGVLVQIPRPERYAIHKLIVADRRRDNQKRDKDIAQAGFLIDVLAEDRPDELADAYQDARARGPKWEMHIARSMKRLSAGTCERLGIQ